ncbi:MAG TPA: FlgD immunoglobulin-like domain containing protein [Candidatus Krumholzibacteria bacterium]|nr:FlgD immunoglobulin-like domain containing protein [Candidatus Krumholzibacteria bacterium]
MDSPTVSGLKVVRSVLTCALILIAATATWSVAQSRAPARERPDDPPGVAAKRRSGTQPAPPVEFGRFTSIQVNVDANGANIVGDAANEPSIAVHPDFPLNIAIGWRQFDTVVSNFRQAGYGYSHDGGGTWTFPGVLDPGQFRSDPVLDYDAEGNFFYCSLRGDFNSIVFKSTDGGATWGPPVFAYGGDKQWIAIDRTPLANHGNIYQAWSTAANPWGDNTFNRSINDGISFLAPSLMPPQPIWGTLDVAPNGTLYVVGVSDFAFDQFSVCRSTNAGGFSPTFTSASVSLGGPLGFSVGPNPGGLMGQAWLAVDKSSGPTAGYIYVMASVSPPGDPADVRFVRSTNGGVSWSSPVRVNDDTPGNGAWQWFATMSVAPDGRIDAVWNDTRNTGVVNESQLYYSYSTDGGASWSVNEPASPVWDSFVGWPNQQKIGDYYDMTSDSTGAHLAYAATFNNEQDVYYMRIGQSVTDVAGQAPDGYFLHANEPNPFSASTTIRYDVPADGPRVTLSVFDVNGRLVRTLEDAFVGGGARTASWDGTDVSGRPVASGVYFCRLQAAGVSRTTKMILVR